MRAAVSVLSGLSEMSLEGLWRLQSKSFPSLKGAHLDLRRGAPSPTPSARPGGGCFEFQGLPKHSMPFFMARMHRKQQGVAKKPLPNSANSD